MTDGTTIDRRGMLGVLGGAAALGAAGPAFARRDDHGGGNPYADLLAGGYDGAKGEFVLPPLPYGYDALEPHIDARTMRIHHDRHHQGYVNGANGALKVLRQMDHAEVPSRELRDWCNALSFNLGGHVNHTLFWATMAPAGGGGGDAPSGRFMRAIERDFSSWDRFRTHMLASANTVKGSGWAWLVVLPASDRLAVIQIEDQECLAPLGVTPLVGVDVWEHAYYLKYQNRRSAYTEAWMNVVHWGRVAGLYEAVTG